MTRGCLDENELAELYDGALTIEHVQDHLASCPSCRKKLALLITSQETAASLAEEVSRDSITYIKQLVYPRPRIIPAYSAIAAVFLLFCFIYLYMLKEISHEDAIDLSEIRNATDIGYIVNLDGTASILPWGESEPRVATLSTPIRSNDTIQIHENAQCKIHFTSGTELALKEKTTIRIGKSAWEFSKGEIWANIVTDQIPLIIATNNGEITVVGTELAVSADNDETNVEVIKGQIKCTSGNEERRVAEGFKSTLRKDAPPQTVRLKRFIARHKFGRLIHSVLPRLKHSNRLIGSRFINSQASDWQISFEHGLSIGTSKRNAQAQLFMKSLITLEKPLNLSCKLAVPEDTGWATHLIFFQPPAKHLHLIFQGDNFVIVSKIGPAPRKLLHRQKLARHNPDVSIDLSRFHLIVYLDDHEVFRCRYKVGFDRIAFGVWIRNSSRQYNETKIESFSITKEVIY